MAAELAVPDSSVLRERLYSVHRRMGLLVARGLDDRKIYLDDRSNMLELNSPKNRLHRTVSELEKKGDKLNFLITAKIGEARMNLAREIASLEALSPLAVLARGYGFVQNEEGKSLSSVYDFKTGENIRITMKDGTARAEITSVEKG